jgi:hypothetical protein
MPTPSAHVRRVLHYDSLDNFLADAEHMARVRYRTIGKWTYAQILDHLGRTMRCGFEGFGFQAPWFVRYLLAPLIKNSFLTKPMKPGFNLPRKAVAILPAENAELQSALESLRQVVARSKRETPTASHPAFGKLASQEWTSLNLRHAELHMSFVIPDETP